MTWKKQLAMVVHDRAEDGLHLTLPTVSGPATTPQGTSEVKQDLQRPPTTRSEAGHPDSEVEVRWHMVFTWQAPMMLMAYSVLFFLLGLSIYVLTPLYDGREFDGEARVSPIVCVKSFVKMSSNDANIALVTRLRYSISFSWELAWPLLCGASIGLTGTLI